MKTIASWNDLRAYGIDALTGEACGLSYRILCDLTAKGKKILEKCLGTPDLALYESWNRGSKEEPHIGCILLPPEMQVPLAVFALLESGCREAWSVRGTGVVGITPEDTAEHVADFPRLFAGLLDRRFAYQGTAGDRNIHVMSGRVH